MIPMIDSTSDEIHRPIRAEPSPIFHRLRFVASCALGGALLTGAVLGHDLSGFDPRSVGAALGLLAGVALVMTRSA